MMNVNFFEKKKINLLPYIIGGFFVVLLAAIGIYLFLARTNYQNTIEEKNNWIMDNSEQVVLSREISQVIGVMNDSESTQEILRENQYPMFELTTDLASAVPNEQDRIVSFSLSGETQVTLVLENTEPSEALAIVENLEEKTYVDSVEFLSASTQSAGDSDMSFDFTIQINPDNFVEEETE